MFKISNSSKLVQKFSNVKVPNFFNKSSFSEIMPTSPSDINLISSVLNKFIYLEKCFRGSLEIIFFVLIFFLELLLTFSEGSGNNSSLSDNIFMLEVSHMYTEMENIDIYSPIFSRFFTKKFLLSNSLGIYTHYSDIHF